MQEGKVELSALLWKIIDDTKVKLREDVDHKVSINKLLSPSQKQELLYNLLEGLPSSFFTKVIKTDQLCNVDKEVTSTVEDFNYSELNFNLILRQVFKVGKSLGFDRAKLYRLTLSQYNKESESDALVNIDSLTKSLTALLYETYGAVRAFDLVSLHSKSTDAEVASRLGRRIPKDANYLVVLDKSLKHYRALGIEVLSEDLKDGFIVIKNRETEEVLTPIGVSSN